MNNLDIIKQSIDLARSEGLRCLKFSHEGLICEFEFGPKVEPTPTHIPEAPVNDQMTPDDMLFWSSNTQVEPDTTPQVTAD